VYISDTVKEKIKCNNESNSDNIFHYSIRSFLLCKHTYIHLKKYHMQFCPTSTMEVDVGHAQCSRIVARFFVPINFLSLKIDIGIQMFSTVAG